LARLPGAAPGKAARGVLDGDDAGRR